MPFDDVGWECQIYGFNGFLIFLFFRGKDVCFGDGWCGLYWFAYVY